MGKDRKGIGSTRGMKGMKGMNETQRMKACSQSTIC